MQYRESDKKFYLEVTKSGVISIKINLKSRRKHKHQTIEKINYCDSKKNPLNPSAKSKN